MGPLFGLFAAESAGDDKQQLYNESPKQCCRTADSGVVKTQKMQHVLTRSPDDCFSKSRKSDVFFGDQNAEILNEINFYNRRNWDISPSPFRPHAGGSGFKGAVEPCSVIFVDENENENGEKRKIMNSLTKTKTKTKNDEN